METLGLPPVQLLLALLLEEGSRSTAGGRDLLSALRRGPCHRPAKLGWGGRWSLWLRSRASVCWGPLTCACFLMGPEEVTHRPETQLGPRTEGTQVSLVFQTLPIYHLDSELNSLE